MKRVCFLLIIVLLLGCFLSACAKTAVESLSTIEKDDDPISWWCPKRYKHVDKMHDSAVYSQLMKETGVSLRFIHPPEGEHRERFLMLMKEDELPDIISHDFINDYPGGVEKALNDGIIIPINNIIDQYCPNLKKFLEERPDIRTMISTRDGSITCFPSIQLEREIRTYMGPFARKDLLEDIGADSPVTVAEWYELLLQLKNKTGVTPLSFYGGKIFDTDFLIGAYGISWGFYIENGEVKYGPMEEGFTDFIRELKKWYEADLISPGVFTDSSGIYAAKAKRGNTGIYVDYVSSMETYRQAIASKNQAAEFLALSYPVLSHGDIPFSGHIAAVFIPFASAYITKDNKDIERTAKLLDYAYSPEGSLLFNFGIEGESYVLDNGIPSYMPEMYASEEGFSEAVKCYLASGPFVRDPWQFEQMLQTDTQRRACELWGATEAESHVLPTVILSAADAEYVALHSKGIDDIILKWLKDYMLDRSGSVTVKQLQDTLRFMGIEDLIAIYQQLLDAKQEVN